LVIDDDLAVRDLLERILHDEGYSVVSAANGRAGLELARTLGPDAIVLDMRMPEVDGWSVLASRKSDEAVRSIPVVLLTQVEEPNRGFALGATEYLLKPVRRAELIEVLDRCYAARSGTALLVDDSAEV
jgi:CheY-like chemotaxis protein